MISDATKKFFFVFFLVFWHGEFESDDVCTDFFVLVKVLTFLGIIL